MDKKDITSIFIISLLLTTFGFLIDSDPINANLWVSVFEYFALTTLIFIVITIFYGALNFVVKNVKRKFYKE